MLNNRDPPKAQHNFELRISRMVFQQGARMPRQGWDATADDALTAIIASTPSHLRWAPSSGKSTKSIRWFVQMRKMKIISFIDNVTVIRKILDHLGLSLSSGTDPPVVIRRRR